MAPTPAPALAGRTSADIVAAMEAFRTQARPATVMDRIAKGFTPEETKALMEEVERPWIAYKVLGAGAIHPREGFQYAFENGADFLCVGMFDFQVAEDAELARLALEKSRSRSRVWS